jgi:transposase
MDRGDQDRLQALHRVRERLVSQRTGIINQIRAFLLERGVAVRQGQRFLRAELHLVNQDRNVFTRRGANGASEVAGSNPAFGNRRYETCGFESPASA